MFFRFLSDVRQIAKDLNQKKLKRQEVSECGDLLRSDPETEDGFRGETSGLGAV
jgi:hypothetical protein